jgi:putative drug exporter of the RND superfamily
VASPYSKAGAPQISRDGTVAFARVTWDKVASQVTNADALNLVKTAESADGPTVQVSLGGQSISNQESAGPGLSVAVGVIAALIILLIVFGGALYASLMPPLTAALALVIATSVISLLTHVMDVASVSTDLAVLIGLGVGVDYGLFILSRHRTGVKAGLSYEDAVAQAVNTSGRTVLFAGTTVCIALLGQFVLGVSFLYGDHGDIVDVPAHDARLSRTEGPVAPRTRCTEGSRTNGGEDHGLLAGMGEVHRGSQGARGSGCARRCGADRSSDHAVAPGIV